MSKQGKAVSNRMEPCKRCEKLGNKCRISSGKRCAECVRTHQKCSFVDEDGSVPATSSDQSSSKLENGGDGGSSKPKAGFARKPKIAPESLASNTTASSSSSIVIIRKKDSKKQEASKTHRPVTADVDSKPAPQKKDRKPAQPSTAKKVTAAQPLTSSSQAAASVDREWQRSTVRALGKLWEELEELKESIHIVQRKSEKVQKEVRVVMNNLEGQSAQSGGDSKRR